MGQSKGVVSQAWVYENTEFNGSYFCFALCYSLCFMDLVASRPLLYHHYPKSSMPANSPARTVPLAMSIIDLDPNYEIYNTCIQLLTFLLQVSATSSA
jgi:hypothetical protein